MKRKIQRICIVLLLIFIILSFWFISPTVEKARSTFHSSQLRKVTVKNGNTERTDYLDADGKITIAAELGYATLIVTKTENNKLEQYFDDQGEPINRRYNGYYAVFREYDERENNIRITYLNRDGEPMIMANGYATEEREYDQSGQITSVRYLDAERNPICSSLYGYGKNNEYDENGRVCRITYIDASGAPMMTGLGYAIICRHFYESAGYQNGKVESEFYFDEKENPVQLSLGQYGVHKEYDEYGRETVLTYLDAEGKPIVTKKGYTTILQTFQADNSVATEQYFDLNGNPYSRSEGQYGEKKENGQTVFLNIAGEETFNLKNLLYNQSWLVIVFALIAVFLTALFDSRWNFIFLILYLGAIAYLTLMFRENDGGKATLELFCSYRRIITDSNSRADILKNIWLFIPLGAILYRIYPKKVILLIPVVISILIEAVQYSTGTGYCELDDVISNSLGGAIGYGTGYLFCNFRNTLITKYSKKRKIQNDP